MRDNSRLHVFDIELLGDQEVYHLGDSISGAIVIEPTSGQVIAKLRVGIHAVAKVAWTGSGGKSTSARSSVRKQDSSKQVHHAVHYFDAERSIYENRRASAATGPDLVKIRSNNSRLGLFGPEEFPFVFKLPESGAPPTWTGLYGSVRYWIEAVVEVCGKECFREDVHQGIIIAPSPITLPDPVTQIQKFPVTGMACVPASISATLQLSQSFYSPGDTITLDIAVQNASIWKMSSDVSLINTQVFLGKSGMQKLIKDSIVRTNGEIVRAHSDGIWRSVLAIPSTVCPSLLDCIIIQCHYTVLLRLRVRSVIPQLIEISAPIVVIQRKTPEPTSEESAGMQERHVIMERSEESHRPLFTQGDPELVENADHEASSVKSAK